MACRTAPATTGSEAKCPIKVDTQPRIACMIGYSPEKDRCGVPSSKLFTPQQFPQPVVPAHATQKH